MKPEKSELEFQLADYERTGRDAPDRIIATPESCEGMLMTDDEIFDYCKDSLAVIRVMVERNPERAVQLRAEFLTDASFLLRIARIKPEEYEMLTVESGAREA